MRSSHSFLRALSACRSAARAVHRALAATACPLHSLVTHHSATCLGTGAAIRFVQHSIHVSIHTFTVSVRALEVLTVFPGPLVHCAIRIKVSAVAIF